MKGVAVVLVALAIVQLMAEPARALTCGDVGMCVAPCVGYLTGQQAAPPAACCDGVRRLKAEVPTTPTRRFACGCIKQAAEHFKNIKDEAVSNLPRLCGTPVPFPISVEVDCNTIP